MAAVILGESSLDEPNHVRSGSGVEALQDLRVWANTTAVHLRKQQMPTSAAHEKRVGLVAAGVELALYREPVRDHARKTPRSSAPLAYGGRGTHCVALTPGYGPQRLFPMSLAWRSPRFQFATGLVRHVVSAEWKVGLRTRLLP